MKYKSIMVLLLLILGYSISYTQNSDISQARNLYHQSVENKSVVDSALTIFEHIQQKNPELEPLCKVYIGSLNALKGKHAKMPWNKLKWVKKGLQIMDQAVDMDPVNPEIRFVRGTTTFFLPSFFKRKEQSRQDFISIIDFLRAGKSFPNETLLKNALEFISEHIDLAKDDSLFVTNYLRQYTNAR